MKVFRLLSYSMSHICLMCYLLVFIKWRYPAKKTVFIAVISVMGLIFLEWIRYDGLNQGEVVNWTIIAQMLIVQGTALVLSKYRDFRGLFTGLTSSNYVLFGNLIARICFAVEGLVWLSVIAGMTVNLLFLAGLAYWLRPSYMEYQTVDRREWFGLCMIPSAFYISLLFLMRCLSGTNLLQNVAMLSVLLTLYMTYGVVFRMINSVNREDKMQKERDMLETSVRSLKRSMEDAYIAERRAAISHHDRKHLIRTLQTLMAKQDYDAVNRLLNQEQEFQEIPVASHYCDNVPINGVVVYYAEAARRNQVKTHISIDFPETMQQDDWELAVVIGNLMENAVAAAGKVKKTDRRRLWLSARKTHGQLLIEVLNTFEGIIEFDEETSLPVTVQNENHGLGLSSVITFAEHRHAVFDCGIEDDKFFVRLLI